MNRILTAETQQIIRDAVKVNPDHVIEVLIDAIGVKGLLDTADVVCHGKAEHIRENWSDGVLAQLWERAGRSLGMAANKVSIIRLSQASGR